MYVYIRTKYDPASMIYRVYCVAKTSELTGRVKRSGLSVSPRPEAGGGRGGQRKRDNGTGDDLRAITSGPHAAGGGYGGPVDAAARARYASSTFAGTHQS
jgi:hypothetical protein